MKKSIKKKIKRIFQIAALLLLLIVLVILYANWKIPYDSRPFVYDNVDSIPPQKAALVLGAAKNIGSRPNLYFTYRIEAAAQLYKAGKVQAFVVSGDNSRHTYNESDDMRKALIEAGVPDSIIHMDFAGFRTLDSVVRMNEIFSQRSFIVVSQEFHNERAVFLAQQHGLQAYGFNAKDLNLNSSSYRTKIREIFARVKVFIDIAIGKEPKFLGEKINI
ncbi:MAG: ElyC/SanA/YdcF family protein [Dysgonomonas sp.]|nr:ElyC/SanA/YdcF family protein [Dysgonomonas sp.]